MNSVKSIAYAEVYRDNPKISPKYFSNRDWKSLCLAGSGLDFFIGAQLMNVLYDERYHESGTMLQLLAAGTLVDCVGGLTREYCWQRALAT